MKKGILSFNTLQFIYRIVFMLLTVFTILGLAQSYFRLSFDATPQESTLFSHAAIYGLSYHDNLTDRTYPGILVSKELPYDAQNIAAEISYGKAYYFNKRNYDDWSVLARSFIPGPGGATAYFFILPNAIYEDKAVNLNITTVMRR